MNKFKEYIINKIDNLLDEGEKISNIVDNLENIFNLESEEAIKELFNNYYTEILEYYFEEVKTPYNYYTKDLKELIQDTFIHFVQWYYDELLLNEE